MEEHNFKLIPILRYFSLILLFLAATAQSGAAELIPNYDNVEHKLKIFDETKNIPLSLVCNNTTPGNKTLTWYRNDVNVFGDTSLKGRSDVIAPENRFIIFKPKEEDAGTYACESFTGERAVFIVVAKVFFKQVQHSHSVVEGEKLTLQCTAYGTDPQIKWIIGNTTYEESEGRIVLSADDRNIKNAILTIDKVELDDRKLYNCTGTNLGIEYSFPKEKPPHEYIYVRVKGKLAALWPFLGICAEVFVLCAIILIYEKRRNKAELEESDTDQSPEQKNDHRGKESEIRQRK